VSAIFVSHFWSFELTVASFVHRWRNLHPPAALDERFHVFIAVAPRKNSQAAASEAPPRL
jgi:hypothetical protein